MEELKLYRLLAVAILVAIVVGYLISIPFTEPEFPAPDKLYYTPHD